MGLFTKEEHKKVIRDDEGVHFETTYNRGSRTPISDKLLSQNKEDKRNWKQQQKEEYRKAFREARLKRIREQGRRAGSKTWGDRLGNWADAMSKQSGGGQRYSSPMEGMFTMGDMGFGDMPRQTISRKKSKGNKKYVVRGGVAYPVAGSKKKKKHKKRSSSSYNPFEFKI